MEKWFQDGTKFVPIKDAMEHLLQLPWLRQQIQVQLQVLIEFHARYLFATDKMVIL
jgi:hypothetical protein